MSFINKLFGMGGEAQIKRIRPLVERINGLEAAMQALSDAEMREMTQKLKQRQAGGEALDDLLPEAFALVREASVRATGMRHFDVQLIGGVVLHQGRIAEMKTGEGKTLVATLPAFLNALTGKGVHIVTVNDYLAKRDSEWMGKIHRFLGLNVGLIVHGLDNVERRAAYAADITYGTNNELGFDYLRDNMVVYKNEMVQRELNFAIVDEVDSILVDEARTPLIISGASEKSTEMYNMADSFVRRLERGPDYKRQTTMEMLENQHVEERGDYVVDEKGKTVVLTSHGIKKAENYFGVDSLGDAANTEINHHINQALRAHGTMRRDRDYVVQNGEVIIVDEFTGRLMIGRRYSEGLHQAIEAKEGVKVERESKTLATITFQNFFRMYNKLSGMTGTAKTEEAEFQGIYKLDVVEIPTHREMIRQDHNDVVFTTELGKYRAVVNEVAEKHKTGQPVLVGTVSVENSEHLSEMLKRAGVRHVVLNAKFHEKEAEIVAQAGKKGMVTIATNMAGRGTDILLGGNPEYMARKEMRALNYEEALVEAATGHAETHDAALIEARGKFTELYEKHKAETDAEHAEVVKLGGLHIIGTERHESRRIDNQLRGRSGRQGDPGSTRFYISLEDPLMRMFGSDRIKALVSRLTPDDDIPMDFGMLSKQIESAQKRVELHNFEIRKHVLQYDDVMNKQREIIYGQRREVLIGKDLKENVMTMFEAALQSIVNHYCPPEEKFQEEWDLDGMVMALERFGLPKGFKPYGSAQAEDLDRETLVSNCMEKLNELYAVKEEEVKGAGGDMREVERVILLRTVDSHWMDHIDAMDQLRQGIGLRAYGNRDPVVEYKIEGFDMFDEMVARIQEETARILLRVSVEKPPQERKRVAKATEASHGGQRVKKPKRVEQKPGRNAPCPCGSGKKYKNCCGRDDAAV